MKKTFKLTAPNKAPDRQAEWVMHEIKKYIGRERRKALPENADYWDFDCKFGDSSETAEVIHIPEINKKIAASASAKKESFYIEVLAKPGYRKKS
jgi:hypothetical protein